VASIQSSKWNVCAALLSVAITAGAQTKTLLNADSNGVLLKGYDPVAYFTQRQAVKGDNKYQSTYAGAIYYFKSDEDKKLFEANPAQYAPQYGGYCAMAAALDRVEDSDPNMFLVHDGKLLLQRNEKARKMFIMDAVGNHRKADQNWPGLIERYGK
jgi:YHS domain-containing protein